MICSALTSPSGGFCQPTEIFVHVIMFVFQSHAAAVLFAAGPNEHNDMWFRFSRGMGGP